MFRPEAHLVCVCNVLNSIPTCGWQSCGREAVTARHEASLGHTSAIPHIADGTKAAETRAFSTGPLRPLYNAIAVTGRGVCGVLLRRSLAPLSPGTTRSTAAPIVLTDYSLNAVGTGTSAQASCTATRLGIECEKPPCRAQPDARFERSLEPHSNQIAGSDCILIS
eukprot:3194750-Rhodomonas_salina.1